MGQLVVQGKNERAAGQPLGDRQWAGPMPGIGGFEVGGHDPAARGHAGSCEVSEHVVAGHLDRVVE